MQTQATQQQQTATMTLPDQEVVQQRVQRDCVARVIFQGRVTQQAIDKLVAYLNLVKGTYPKVEDVEAP